MCTQSFTDGQLCRLVTSYCGHWIIEFFKHRKIIHYWISQLWVQWLTVTSQNFVGRNLSSYIHTAGTQCFRILWRVISIKEEINPSLLLERGCEKISKLIASIKKSKWYFAIIDTKDIFFHNHNYYCIVFRNKKAVKCTEDSSQKI